MQKRSSEEQNAAILRKAERDNPKTSKVCREDDPDKLPLPNQVLHTYVDIASDCAVRARLKAQGNPSRN